MYRYAGQPEADLLFLSNRGFYTKIQQDDVPQKMLINYVAVLTVYLRSDYCLLNEEKSIKRIPELTHLCELVEKKVCRINMVEDYSNLLKNKIYNL